MENSISLGLIHGLVYGIVPVAPWFVALKRYLLEGKEKGQLAVAGTIAGQVTLLALTFFGWSQVLWVWYYFEPALIILGTMAVVRCAMDCWVEQESSLRTAALGTGQLTSKKEGFYYFLVNFGLMFCNPMHLEGSQTLISSIPGNRYFYLMAFTVSYTAIIFIFWSTIGHRIFGKAYTSFGAQQTLNRFRIRRVAVGIVAALFLQFANCTPEALVIYHFDSLLAYTPFDNLKHYRTRGYIWEPVNNGGVEYSRQSYRATNKAGIGYENGARNWVQFKPFWNTETRFEECNQIRERDLSNEDWSAEATFHEFQGLNQGLLRARYLPFNLYMVPNWEKQEDKNYLQTLREIRNEMDEKLTSQTTGYERFHQTPFTDNWDYEVDLHTDPIFMEQRMQTQAGYGDMVKYLRRAQWDSNYAHRGNGMDVKASYAKLHKVPAEIRLPWHYPVIKPADLPSVTPGTDTPESVQRLNQEVQANLNFFSNEPDKTPYDVYRRVWEHRKLGKVTPPPFDPDRPQRIADRTTLRQETYISNNPTKSK